MTARSRGVIGLVLGCWVLAGGMARGGEESRKPQVPELKVERYTLPNGLTVLLHEDHKTPVAAVDLYYKVGSKDEKPGRTGFAHLFEHMMFLGSKHHDEDYFRPLDASRPSPTPPPTRTWTEYYERVPSHAARARPLARGRSHGLAVAGDDPREAWTKSGNVVKNEPPRAGGATCRTPAGRMRRSARRLYPAGHPYRHSVIGSMADLSAASQDDVAAFFRTYYSPDNAILCVAGDFAPAQVRGWIDRYFGPLPWRTRRSTPPKPNVPALTAPKPIRLTDAVSLPRAPAHLADRARRACRRAGARRPGGRPGRPRQGEPALSRQPDVVDRPLAASVAASAPDPPALRRVRGRAVLAHPDEEPRRSLVTARPRRRSSGSSCGRPERVRSRSARRRTSARAS